MSAPKKIEKQNTHYLDNTFWNKEAYLDGSVVLHTIKCKKIVNQVVENLQNTEYKIDRTSNDSELIISNKNNIVSTETHEIHVDKVKVTEGSLVRVISGKSDTSVLINENEPVLSLTDEKVVPLSDFKKIERERLVFKSEVARTKNSFFFRAKDSENIYKLGDTFYKDFKAGYKHFGFANINSAEAQKRSIVGVASFMYYFENLRILVLTDKISSTFYDYLKRDEHISTEKISVYPEFTYEAYKHEGLYYLEVDEISSKSKDHHVVGLEYLLRKIIDDYDVVLYDLPSTEVRRTKYEIYFPLLQMIENVTLSLNLQGCTFKQVDELKSHFLNYKIKLKGCVIEKSTIEGVQ